MALRLSAPRATVGVLARGLPTAAPKAAASLFVVCSSGRRSQAVAVALKAATGGALPLQAANRGGRGLARRAWFIVRAAKDSDDDDDKDADAVIFVVPAGSDDMDADAVVFTASDEDKDRVVVTGVEEDKDRAIVTGGEEDKDRVIVTGGEEDKDHVVVTGVEEGKDCVVVTVGEEDKDRVVVTVRDIGINHDVLVRLGQEIVTE